MEVMDRGDLGATVLLLVGRGREKGHATDYATTQNHNMVEKTVLILVRIARQSRVQHQ